MIKTSSPNTNTATKQIQPKTKQVYQPNNPKHQLQSNLANTSKPQNVIKYHEYLIKHQNNHKQIKAQQPTLTKLITKVNSASNQNKHTNHHQQPKANSKQSPEVTAAQRIRNQTTSL